jgi:DNA recombination protein RmuC
MVEIALGLCIVIAGVLGLLFGRLLGQGSAKAEVKAQLDTISILKSEKTRLDELAVTQANENQRLREQIARAEEREVAQEQKYSQMKADVDKAFADLASKALRDNNESFLNLAKQKLNAQSDEAKQTLAQKEEAIKNLLDPLGATLRSLDEQTRGMEVARSGAYAKVETLVETMQSSIPKSLDALKSETSQLVSALRAPKTRGDWGQEQLQRCVEVAGMVEHCSFRKQVSTRDDQEQLLRPDMTIQLPNGRTIIVDAKTPSDLFSESKEVSDPGAMKALLKAHAARVKQHLSDLSSKAYWKQFEHSPEFVICFLPSEALFSAALEGDPELINFGARLNVVMATPTTLIALLKAVAYGWQQSRVAESAKAIQDTGHELYRKLINVHEYLSNLGKALKSAIAQYNNFVGAVEGKDGAFYRARKLGALTHDNQQMEVLEPLSVEPRLLTGDDWASASEPALAATTGASETADA